MEENEGFECGRGWFHGYDSQKVSSPANTLQIRRPLQELELKLNVKVTVEHTNMINKPFSNLIEPNK